MSNAHAELAAICLKWRTRARAYMAEAEHAHRAAEIVRLTAMASTLDYAADDLSIQIDRLKQPPLIGSPGEG